LNAQVPSENTEHRKLAAIMFTGMVGYRTLALLWRICLRNRVGSIDP
jgi:hypothetical protein